MFETSVKFWMKWLQWLDLFGKSIGWKRLSRILLSSSPSRLFLSSLELLSASLLKAILFFDSKRLVTKKALESWPNIRNTRRYLVNIFLMLFFRLTYNDVLARLMQKYIKITYTKSVLFMYLLNGTVKITVLGCKDSLIWLFLSNQPPEITDSTCNLPFSKVMSLSVLSRRSVMVFWRNRKLLKKTAVSIKYYKISVSLFVFS